MAPAVLAGEEPLPSRNAARNRVSGGAPAQRARLVAAMGELAAEIGAVSAIGVHHVCQRAGMSRRTFYDLYQHRDECFVATLQEAHDRLLAHIEHAVDAAGPVWEDRAVAATHALVGTLAADRVLAHLCAVSTLSGGSDAVRLRREAHDRIIALLADAPASGFSPEQVLAGALGGVWELVHRNLTDDPGRPPADLGDVAVFLMLSPFVGRRRAIVLAGRGVPTAFVTRWRRDAGTDRCSLVVTELTRQTLTYLEANPGASNIDIARAIDVRHESQISRHLGRLERAGIVERRRAGRTNAWTLTARGQEAVRSVSEARLFGAVVRSRAERPGAQPVCLSELRTKDVV